MFEEEWKQIFLLIFIYIYIRVYVLLLYIFHLFEIINLFRDHFSEVRNN